MEASGASGVPEITQVEVLSDAHEGSAVVDAFTVQFVIEAPRESRVVGLTENATATVPEVPVAPAYESTGMLAATCKFTKASAELPAEFVAIKVNWVEVSGASGVPEITQVEVFTEAQEGSDVVEAFTAQFVIEAPRASREVGLTENATATVPEVPVAPA